MGYAQNTTDNSLAWNNKEKKEKTGFTLIEKSDMDGDGVRDMDDCCQGTPKGVKVDRKGCPLDSDGDGVADYLDKEANTPAGSAVDAEGKTITDDMLTASAINYSYAMERRDMFNNNPSAASLNKIDTDIYRKKSSSVGITKIPSRFLDADLNKDGIIISSEVSAIIFGSIEGSNNYSAEKVNQLIDVFFGQ